MHGRLRVTTQKEVFLDRALSLLPSPFLPLSSLSLSYVCPALTLFDPNASLPSCCYTFSIIFSLWHFYFTYCFYLSAKGCFGYMYVYATHVCLMSEEARARYCAVFADSSSASYRWAKMFTWRHQAVKAFRNGPRGLMEDLSLSNDSRTGFFLLKFHVVIFKSRNLLLVTDFLMITHLFVVYSFKILSLIFLIFFLTSVIFSPRPPF